MKALVAESTLVIVGADAEAVHRMRVASRRLREALRVARALTPRPGLARLSRRVRSVTRALGRLREDQVSLTLLADFPSTGEAAAGLDWLRGRFERRVNRWATRAQKRLSASDLGALERRVEVALAAKGSQRSRSSDVPFPAELVRRRAEVAERRLGEAHRHRSDESLHALRIAAKRLRYLLELVAVGTASGARSVAQFKKLQDALGNDHDLSVLAAAVAREIERVDAGHEPILAGSLAAAAGLVAEEQVRCRARLDRQLGRWPAGAIAGCAAVGTARRAPRRPTAPATSRRRRPA